jgi:hypothetical protein
MSPPKKKKKKKNGHKEKEEDANNVFVRTEKRGVTLQNVSNFCIFNMSIYFQVNTSMAITFVYKYLLTFFCSIKKSCNIRITYPTFCGYFNLVP